MLEAALFLIKLASQSVPEPECITVPEPEFIAVPVQLRKKVAVPVPQH